MKRVTAAALLVLGLALGLSACGQGTGASQPGLPPLPTGVEVRFPAAPANTYLSLMTDAGESVYQIPVPQGQTSVAPDPSRWRAASERAVAAETLVPQGVTASLSPSGVKALLLHWVMWQDKNSDGKQGEGEALDLMTHDRVAYASAALRVTFQTASPDMTQVWALREGWSRAEHEVYLPLDSKTYRRSLRSAEVQRYTLHVTTPITSQ